jgi:acyl carrier protein
MDTARVRRAGPAGGVDFVEPGVRRVVAETLGVGPGELTPDVSLPDDLAADSLDLVELAVALEGELGVTLPEAVLDDVRTYGDVVTAVRAAVLRDGAWAVPLPFRAGLVGPEAGAARQQRAGVLTPYERELITAEAQRLGPGGRLDLEVGADAPPDALASVRRAFGPVAARGVHVLVHRRGH